MYGGGKAPRPFDSRYEIVTESGCFIWMDRIGPHGYGRLTAGKKHWDAHRYAWVQKHGPVPSKLCICHTCDVRSCVNTDHMFIGTRSDNMQDMHRKGRAGRHMRKKMSRRGDD